MGREEGVDGCSLRWLQAWSDCWSMELTLACQDASEMQDTLGALSGCVRRSKSFVLERSRRMRLVSMWTSGRDLSLEHGMSVEQEEEDWGKGLLQQTITCTDGLNVKTSTCSCFPLPDLRPPSSYSLLLLFSAPPLCSCSCSYSSCSSCSSLLLLPDALPISFLILLLCFPHLMLWIQRN